MTCRVFPYRRAPFLLAISRQTITTFLTDNPRQIRHNGINGLRGKAGGNPVLSRNCDTGNPVKPDHPFIR